MVNYSTAGLNATFAALADPTRRAILGRLTRGECSVTQLASPFDMSLPAISKHLRVLEEAGLLVREKDGRVRRCCLVVEPLKEASEWIAAYRRFWEKKLGALDDYLRSQGKEQPTWPRSPHPQTPRFGSHAPFTRRATESSRHGRTRKH